MWRVGYDTPKNYNDNALFCGGFQNQYGPQGGKCGICGDPYQGPRDNEVGGRYYSGTITRVYKQGDMIKIAVEITANHLGWFEFKVCPADGSNKEVSQSCLDKHVLTIEEGSETKYFLGSKIGWVNLRARLPRDVTCDKCVFQWRWHTGNSWGVDPDGTTGIGYGPQEEFYGCANIAIHSVPGSGSGSEVTTPDMIQSATPSPATTRPVIPIVGTCFAVSPMWKGQPQLDQWCDYNCRRGNCPGVCACQ